MKPIRFLLLAALVAAPAAVHAQAADSALANWHLLDPATDRVPGIAAERAYRELLTGRTPQPVVVAIIDSGIEIDHPELASIVWTNAREVAGNGRDDDGNGYVDDVHGWDFIGGRDGTDVSHDTYEITRLYALCRAAGATEAGGTPCSEIRPAFEARRAEAQGLAQQVSAIEQMVVAVRQALGRDEVTVEALQGLQSDNPQVMQARTVLSRILAAGYSIDDIMDQAASIRGQVEFGYNPDFNPRNIVGDDYANTNQRGYGNAEVEGPDASHGTHVAGIVAALRDGTGVSGVSSAVRVMVLRAVPDGDERDKDVANAIRYAVDNGARVINMSFGKSHSPQKDVVDEAVRYAESKGVLLVHAAGNDGADLNVAGNFPNQFYRGGGRAANWIEVGASSWEGPESLPATFSNWGRGKVDVFAPGSDILSLTPDAGFGRNSGTSMAAPVVSGVAATLLSYFPQLTAVQVRDIILRSATPYADTQVVRPGSENERVPFSQLSDTGGVVNLYNAVQMAQQMSR